MPRTADHAERRRQIADAAVTIALDEGLGRITVARVGRRAGVSVGLVQHYFPTKELLVQRAYADLLAAVDARVAAVVEAGEERGLTIREMAATALGELLPTDDERRAECLARAELQALSGRDPGLAGIALEADRALRVRLRQVVENAQQCGETPRDASSVEVADRLWAATTGVSATLLVDPGFPAEPVLAEAVLRAFPGACRHRS